MRIGLIKCQNGSSYNRMDLGEDIYMATLLPMLRDTAHDVFYDDHCFAYIDDFKDLGKRADKILERSADLLMFSVRQNTSNLFFTLRFLTLLRRRGYRGWIGLYGETGADLDHILLEHDVNFVVVGEEPAIVGVIEALAAEQPLEECEGLAIRGSRGVTLTRRGQAADLDSLPHMARYGLDDGLVPASRQIFYKANIQGSRGCYARCSFCHETARSTHFAEARWRPRSADGIADEMQRVFEVYGVRHFFFQDSNFMGPGSAGQRRAIDLAHRLEMSQSDFKFIINTRVSDVEPETMLALKSAGLGGLFLGVETFVPRRLKRFVKDASVADAERAFAILDELGLKVRVGLILFDHDSSPEEVLFDLEQIASLSVRYPRLKPNPNFLLNILAPKGGTPLADELDGLLTEPQMMRYEHPEHLRVMQMRFSPRAIKIEDPRCSALAEVLRLLGYEVMLQWTERQEEIANFLGSSDPAHQMLLRHAHDWIDNIYDFTAALSVRLARQAAKPAMVFNSTDYVKSGYEYVFRNFLAYNRKYLGEQGLYLYTPTTDCTPKALPNWLDRQGKTEWRSWKTGIGVLPPVALGA